MTTFTVQKKIAGFYPISQRKRLKFRQNNQFEHFSNLRASNFKLKNIFIYFFHAYYVFFLKHCCKVKYSLVTIVVSFILKLLMHITYICPKTYYNIKLKLNITLRLNILHIMYGVPHQIIILLKFTKAKNEIKHNIALIKLSYISN